MGAEQPGHLQGGSDAGGIVEGAVGSLPSSRPTTFSVCTSFSSEFRLASSECGSSKPLVAPSLVSAAARIASADYGAPANSLEAPAMLMKPGLGIAEGMKGLPFASRHTTVLRGSRIPLSESAAKNEAPPML